MCTYRAAEKSACENTSRAPHSRVDQTLLPERAGLARHAFDIHVCVDSFEPLNLQTTALMQWV